MKKIFFFATMLLSIAAIAQQRTFVKSVGTNYAAKQVTFNISWAAGSRGTVGANTYNSKVWVLVDYQEVQNGVTVGNWKRANVVFSSLPAGCTADGTNTKGFWYQGQETAAQNASITLMLSGVPAQFKWCAVVSDCPPKVAASSNGSYTFAGTPPFVLAAANGAIQQVNGTTLAHSALTITPYRLTDQTNCPGVFCPYTGSDLYMDATHLCQLRTGGAKNWEAWIKDARDNNLYRIVQMPDNYWWMAQDLNYATNYHISCTDNWGRDFKMYYQSGSIGSLSVEGRANCPAGWIIPSEPTWRNMYTKAGGIAAICLSGGGDGYCATKEDNWSFRIAGSCCSVCHATGSNTTSAGHYWVPSTGASWIRVTRFTWGDVYPNNSDRSDSVRCMKK